MLGFRTDDVEVGGIDEVKSRSKRGKAVLNEPLEEAEVVGSEHGIALDQGHSVKEIGVVLGSSREDAAN